MGAMLHLFKSLGTSGVLLLLYAVRGSAFCPAGAIAALRLSPTPQHAVPRVGAAASSAALGSTHALQRLWDELSRGAELDDVEDQALEVEAEVFAQASSWSKTFTPLRTVVAEVADSSMSISVLVLPSESQPGRGPSLAFLF